MNLNQLDWGIIIGFFALSLFIGALFYRRASQGFTEFFLSGRNMPWWLLGISMVATTFSADTPNLVTDIVRKNGVSGNWVWWAFLLTGMLTVFVYAKLWRRSGVNTDLEFYELRYSGGPAAFLRAFRAIYLGVLFNVFIMATVMLAAIKIGGAILGLSPVQTLLIASVVTVIYTSLGGLRGVIVTDFFQFLLAMVGTIWAATYLLQLPEIGGLNNLLAHEKVAGKLNLLPDFSDTSALIPLLIIPLAVQWWSVWYPGAEPGGGGYVAQRMLSAKDEKNAVGATLLFNIAHYALRPWPWILIALCSVIIFPDVASLEAAFPDMEGFKVDDDLAYPAMLTYLPNGLLGLVIASLIAAFMSTISTHLNWGSSYIVHDFYLRFIKPEASNKEQVLVGRISTLVLMLLSGLIAYYLINNALEGFEILLQMGAGTGLIFILRWFWWRINAYSELTAMIASFIIAVLFKIFLPDTFPSHWELLIGVGLTTVAWVIVTLLTQPADDETLISFFKLIRPHKSGWKRITEKGLAEGSLSQEDLQTGRLPLEILAMVIGCFTVYGALFATGYWIYGNTVSAWIATIIALVGSVILIRLFRVVIR
jgi:SSS family solute:Na+ symporter